MFQGGCSRKVNRRRYCQSLAQEACLSKCINNSAAVTRHKKLRQMTHDNMERMEKLIVMSSEGSNSNVLYALNTTVPSALPPTLSMKIILTRTRPGRRVASVRGMGMTRMMKSARIARIMSAVNRCAWLMQRGLAPLIVIFAVSVQYAEMGLQTEIYNDICQYECLCI